MSTPLVVPGGALSHPYHYGVSFDNSIIDRLGSHANDISRIIAIDSDQDRYAQVLTF